MTKGMSRRAYAKRRGVVESAVRQAIAAGRIRTAVLPDGTIDPDVADREWARNTDPSKPRNSVTGDPKHRKDSPDDPSTPMGATNGKGADGAPGYAKARGIREVYAARLERLEYEERAGSLVDRQLVERGAFTIGAELREKALLLSTKLAKPIARITDERKCRELLRAELRGLVEDLEKSLRRAARGELRRRR